MMNTDEHVDLTKQWIMTMLYDGPKTFEKLVENGCRVMVFGHNSFDEFKDIFDSLTRDKFIDSSSAGAKLTARGIFTVKKNTILPLLRLTENPKHFHAFVIANQEKCDITFLEILSDANGESEKIKVIKDHSVQNYIDIAKITNLIPDFLEKINASGTPI
ncbi:MAG: hypothetical protein OES23_07320 [Nitrosopumilus sp.]|nr:hypothetical protein [Nitrosopumilus sp.]